MNSRNLICWAVVVVTVTVLVVWGATRPLSMVRGRRSAWVKFLAVVESASAPRRGAEEDQLAMPPPPAPPEPMTRTQAEDLIKVSALVNHAGALMPRLRSSVRVSPVPVEETRELDRGASRFTAPPDVPAGFEWPLVNGQALRLIAQIRLGDVAPLDEDGLLPQTGWLCFFYADALEPPARGMHPADRGAWHVAYFDDNVEALERRQPPTPLEDKYLPCRVRFWQGWTLPPLAEEPDLIWEKELLHFYPDLCAALSGRPQEPGWHHLLGYAQNLGGPMPPVCELASQGVAVDERTNLDDPKIKTRIAGAEEWVLLFQVEVGALRLLDAPPGVSPWQIYPATSRLYYWIRAADLRARDFSRVWLLRQGYSEADWDAEYDEQEDLDEDGGDG